MRDVLPAEILRAAKMGFPVPIGAWLRGPYRGIVDELVLSPRALERGLFDPAAIRTLVARHAAGEDHTERLWSLVNLEIWHRVVVDGEPADSCTPLTTPPTRTMHILWVKNELLHPLDKGGRIRTYEMLRRLRDHHRVTYIALDDGTITAEQRAPRARVLRRARASCRGGGRRCKGLRAPLAAISRTSSRRCRSRSRPTARPRWPPRSARAAVTRRTGRTSWCATS